MFKTQAQHDFEQAERISGVLIFAIVTLWVFLKWDYYFPSQYAPALSSHIEATPAYDTPTPPRKGKKRQKAAEASALPATDNDAAPIADLPPADVEAYIRHWAPTAVEEMRRTGIPASISLAQGIVESRAGRSGLATTANNHFGIKCHVRTKCRAGHCINFTDDDDLDYFLVFQNPYKSWKAHSEFLKRPRYAKCFQQNTFTGWARALKAAGYATAPNYANILININKRYDLERYDE